MNVTNYLKLIYNQPGHPAFMSGAPTLLREVRKKYPLTSLQAVQKFLKTRLEYNLHTERNKRKKKVHPKFITTSPYQSVSCDLAFFAKNKLIYLMCIDDHSGMKYAQYVGNRKTASSTLRAMQKILKRMPVRPARIRIDRGTEFAALRTYLSKEKIALTHLDTYQKAYNAEAFIGQLRKLFRRYKTKTNRQDIRPAIQSLVNSMNKKYNRVIKMSPEEAANPANAGIVFKRRFLSHLRHRFEMPEPKYREGTRVRILNFKNAAEEKSTLTKHQQRYSSTVFTVYKALQDTYPQQYLLSDSEGNIISRRFLERHLIDIDEQ